MEKKTVTFFIPVPATERHFSSELEVGQQGSITVRARGGTMRLDCDVFRPAGNNIRETDRVSNA